MRSRRRSARPGMAATVDGPILQQYLTAARPIEGAGKIPSTSRLSTIGTADERSWTRALKVVEETHGVGWMDDAILVTVENDHRLGTRCLADSAGAGAVAHRRERAADRGDISTGKAGMNTDSNIKLGVGGRYDGGGSASRRDAGNIDARRVCSACSDSVEREGGNHGWLAAAAPLIAKPVPVPAAAKVRGRRLLRIKDEEAQLIRERIHACAGREITSGLGTAVKHDDKRHAAAR